MTPHSLPTLDDSALRQAIAVIGREDITDEALEAEVLQLAGDRMLARRIIDWLPEIFGLVLIPHIGNVTLPRTFSAMSRAGNWMTFAFTDEPLFEPALRLAIELARSSQGNNLFGKIALRSSMVAAVNKALHANTVLDGGTLGGPALIGIPAEVYLPAPKSFWRRLFS